ncbi:MAG: hypothetical protein HGA31_05560 [Candidatus Moranbacteria bacterium]|nr:hypothetical protein [Candidatus Moranbacteria bacterium]
MNTTENTVTVKVPMAERYKPASIKPGLRFYIYFVGNTDGRTVFMIYRMAEKYLLVLPSGTVVGPKNNEDLLSNTLYEVVSKQEGGGVMFTIESFDGKASTESASFTADVYGQSDEFVELPVNVPIPIIAIQPLALGDKTRVLMKDDSGDYVMHSLSETVVNKMTDFFELDMAGMNPHLHIFTVVSDDGYRMPKITRRQ